MNSNLTEQLNDLKNEDFIWIIYFFLAIASILSNQFERNSLIRNNRRFNSASKSINITIFAITLFIYIYFAYINWRDIERIKKGVSNSNRNILENQARLIAALLFLVGGAIYLIVEIQSGNANEIGFI